jgi:hypothetical protein
MGDECTCVLNGERFVRSNTQSWARKKKVTGTQGRPPQSAAEPLNKARMKAEG